MQLYQNAAKWWYGYVSSFETSMSSSKRPEFIRKTMDQFDEQTAATPKVTHVVNKLSSGTMI